MLLRMVFVAVACCALAGGATGRREAAVILDGPLVAGTKPDTGCGMLLWNSDWTFEACWAWQYEGVVPPCYGAFAEAYHGEWGVCAALFGFTRSESLTGKRMDVYLWEDAGGVPGNILCLVTGVSPGPVAQWPNVSFHTVELNRCCTGSDWWVGYWGDWPGQLSDWFLAADMDGPGGHPRTNIAPGLGYPTGWQNVDGPFGPTEALAIGAEVVPCGSTPTRETTWGRIKSTYRQR